MKADRSYKRNMLIRWGIKEVGKGRKLEDVQADIGQWMKRSVEDVKAMVSVRNSMNRYGIISAMVAAALTHKMVLRWLRRNMPRLHNIDENDETAIHGEMVEDGFAMDTDDDFSVVSGTLSAIREEMAWVGEDFRHTVMRLGSDGRRVLAADELENFLREWKSGEYGFMAFYPGRTRPGRHPGHFVELKPLSAQGEESARQVVVKPLRFEKTPDYAFLTFVGSAGRTDTYMLTKKPLEELFPGAVAPRPRVTVIADSVMEKLSERGLHSLGRRYGKAGEQFGLYDSARRVSVGGRDFLLNVFMVQIDNDFALRRPDEGWRMKDVKLLSQVDDADIDKAVAWVKAGPTMQEVRNAAREEYKGKPQSGDERNFVVKYGG